MPIEFRCSHCGKLLRTGDETAGRQAQCPECGSLTEVPAGTSGTIPPLAPLGTGGAADQAATSGSPFGPGTAPPASDSENPYQSPYRETGYVVAPAERVSGPATALVVTSILNLIAQGFLILWTVIVLTTATRPAVRHQNDFDIIYGFLFWMGAELVSFALAVLVLVGALKMRRLQSYSLAMASAIVAMIPCMWPCCLLGLPFGIWALVVLNDESVKAAFRR